MTKGKWRISHRYPVHGNAVFQIETRNTIPQLFHSHISQRNICRHSRACFYLRTKLFHNTYNVVVDSSFVP